MKSDDIADPVSNGNNVNGKVIFEGRSSNGNAGKTSTIVGIVPAVNAESELVNRIELTLLSNGVTDLVSIETGQVQFTSVPDVLVIVSSKGLSQRNTLIGYWRKLWPSVQIIVICPSDTRAGIRSTIDAGAAGFVFDDAIEQTLLPTINAVAVGQVVVPSPLKREVDAPTLSGREKQIVGLVVMGLSNKEIAGRLYVSESTVKCHLSSVFQKLGVRSRHEAVNLILDPGRNLGLGILSISNSQRVGVEVHR